MDDRDLPDPRERTNTQWLANAINDGRWLEGIAFLLVGMEFNVPRTFTLVRAAFREHGFSDHDLTFLTNHIIADEQHGSSALKLVARKVSQLDDPEPVVCAVAEGAEAFRRVYGGPT